MQCICMESPSTEEYIYMLRGPWNSIRHTYGTVLGSIKHIYTIINTWHCMCTLCMLQMSGSVYREKHESGDTQIDMTVVYT